MESRRRSAAAMRSRSSASLVTTRSPRARTPITTLASITSRVPDRGALLEAHPGRHREELRRGHRDRLGVATEARERDDALPCGERAVGAGTEALDRTRDLVAHHVRA